MPKYLRTSGITAEVEGLIREAKSRLYIISPYLKLSDNIKELLNDKEREKVEVRIVFGKQELNPTEMSYIQTLKYVRLYFSKNLHAKCYLNEKKMIICSMNLYEFSQQHNREMGILIDNEIEVDRPVYDDAWKDIESIIYNATDFAYVEAPKEKVKVERETTDSNSQKQEAVTQSSTTLKGKFLSATGLSKELGISAKDLHHKFEKIMWIEKKNEEWHLTSLGKSKGAEMKKGQYGEYIAYPDTVIKELQ
ncbi:phospholipase D family protein [Flavobacterium sp. I-SCBP12n]|uniref:Phospholipase D family protein n=1 Tax=Flavobacterium pygoscelis TaxID=2893176 RepID=A0A9X1XWM4_9FLAO|nr:phospholipase D family protein [Flavobacterium pygoscelis]MCK8143116.1 phospholipase D family protein [Flavobacterium pygoscelis]